MFKIDSVYHDTDPNWYSDKNGRVHILTMVTKGHCYYLIDNERVKVSKGELLYIPARASRFGSSDPSMAHQKYSCIITKVAEDCPISLFKSDRYKKIRTNHYEYMKQRFVLLFQQWIGQQSYYRDICFGIVYEMLYLFSKELNADYMSPQKIKLVKKIEQFILENYERQITIEELAHHIGKSPNYTIVLFREVTGQSPIQFLHSIRVSAAKDLLEQTNMSIASIAYYVGFCNQSYMNRIFKKITGMTPSKIRK
jgi:AraC-like DNA-binding protein